MAKLFDTLGKNKQLSPPDPEGIPGNVPARENASPASTRDLRDDGLTKGVELKE